jgi:hypothetical protein
MAVAENGGHFLLHRSIKVSLNAALITHQGKITSSPTPPPSPSSSVLQSHLSQAAQRFRPHHPSASSLLPPPPLAPSPPPPHLTRTPSIASIHLRDCRYMMSPPSNNVTLAVSASTAASRASFPSQNERERSRNAKAQARHRAKRKAYVEQVQPFSARSFASVG